MINWFRKLLYIVQNYDSLASEVQSNQRCCTWLKSEIDDRAEEFNRRCDWLQDEVNEGVQVIKDRTELHVDVSPSMKSGPHQIVLIGKYNNRDYVQTFSVASEDFRGLVQHCIEMQKYAHRGRIDAVPEMKAIINEESMRWWNE
jgi:hypothetical protein